MICWLALCLPSVALAQTPAPDSFLVRRTVHIDDETTGLRYNSEFAIFRDGLVIGSIRAPGRTQVVRARGTLGEVRQLQRVLSQNRFGSEVGRCYYRDQPGQGAVYRSAITWFGRTGERKMTVTIGDPFAVLCSDGFINSIEAIQQFYFDAIGRPDAQFEDLPQDIFGTAAGRSLP
jgi:hypothetical protein